MNAEYERIMQQAQQARKEQNERHENVAKVRSMNSEAQTILSPFVGRPVNEWITEAMKKPMPKPLFGHFWIQGELCVLFASTNTGKSILSVQMADYISCGVSNDPFTVSCGPQKVLYFDFELSDRQFTKRYSETDGERYLNPYSFHPNFIRYEKQSAAPPDGQTMTDFYLDSTEKEVQEQDAKVVIIDNITWINSRLEKAADAGPFMQRLNDIKKDNDLSILLIAHTPKRSAGEELSINDLQGSAMLMNFMDSAFAIGASKQDPALRYIKQVKVRDAEHVYNSENVVTCYLEKAGNFLGYRFEEFGEERHHTRTPSDDELNDLDRKIIDLYEETQGSYREIAKELRTSKSKVSRVLKDYKENGVPF